MSDKFKWRIGVGGPDEPRSAAWLIFSNGDDVYAAHRTMMGVEKFSFHQSRICRQAFVGQRTLPSGMKDRVLMRWTRAVTPPAATNGAVAVLSVVIPTAHLSTDLALPKKETMWVAPAPADQSTVLRLFFTRDSEGALHTLFAGKSEVIAYQPLPSGEAFAITALRVPWEGRTIIFERSGGGEEIVLPCFPTPGMARPVSMSFIDRPDEARCFELTGWRMPEGAAAKVFRDADCFTSTGIIDKGTNKGG